MKIAFVFPGQGAQAIGMGRALYEGSDAARDVLDACNRVFGGGLLSLCFDGPESDLKTTKNTQPALYAVSCAAFAAVRETGLSPAACAGHSIGEYAALYAAGAFDVATGMELVLARAAAMSAAADAAPGIMAAVLGLDSATVANICAQVSESGEVVVAANDNSPGQIVISGTVAGVEAASTRLKEAGAKRVLPLAVSGAFHSPLMRPAAETLAPILAAARIERLKLPVVANVTADYEWTDEEIRANLIAQVAGSVRWVETISRLASDGHARFVECGPGTVLAGLIKRIAPDATTVSVADTDAANRAAITFLSESLS